MLGYETPSEEISNQASGRTEDTSHTRFPIVLRMWGKLVALSSVLDAKLPFSVTLQTLAFLIVMTWFALFLPLRSSSINDYDLGWHLRSGEWIMQHHELH